MKTERRQTANCKWMWAQEQRAEQRRSPSSVFVRNFCFTNSIRHRYQAFSLCPRDAAAEACSFKFKINYSDGYPINISLLKGGEIPIRGSGECCEHQRDPLFHVGGEITVFNLLQDIMFFESPHLKFSAFKLWNLKSKTADALLGYF